MVNTGLCSSVVPKKKDVNLFGGGGV